MHQQHVKKCFIDRAKEIVQKIVETAERTASERMTQFHISFHG